MAKRILVVEDNVLLAEPLVRLLGRFGYDAEFVTSCKSARQLQGTFDAGVLDLELVDGSGLDLHFELLEKGTIGTVVFFSGTMDDVLIRRAERFAPCVQKADGIASLVTALGQALDEGARQAAGGAADAPSTARRT